jgi:hypothetical protein
MITHLQRAIKFLDRRIDEARYLENEFTTVHREAQVALLDKIIEHVLGGRDDEWLREDFVTELKELRDFMIETW